MCVCVYIYIYTYTHTGSVADGDVEILMQQRAPVEKPFAADIRDTNENTNILRKEPAFWAQRLIRELGEYSSFSEVRNCVCL